MGTSLRIPLLLSVFAVLSSGCLFEVDDEPGRDEDRLSGRHPREEAYPADDKKKGDQHEKVVVCHVPPGNPGRAHTIEVGASAVKAHLKHGDSLGHCQEKDEYADCECHGARGPHPGSCDHDGDCACKPRHRHDECDDPRHHHDECACEHRHDARDGYGDGCAEQGKDDGKDKDDDKDYGKDKDDGKDKDHGYGYDYGDDSRDGGRKYP